MKIIDKYILRQYLGPLFYCLITFCMVFVIYDLFDNLSKFIDAKARITHIFQYYLFLLGPTLEYIMPASLLLATLYTLWHLARNNELIAMRASGIGIYRIVLPILCVAFILSLTSAFIKESVAPKTYRWSARFKDEGAATQHKMLQNQPYYNSTYRRQWLTGKMDLMKPDVLINVEVRQERDDGAKDWTLVAARAEWLDGKWWFYNGSIQEFVDGNSQNSTRTPINKHGKEMAELREKPHDFVNQIKPWEFLSSLEMAQYLKSHSDLSKDAIARRTFDLHSRMAMPWACLIVTLFAIPVGATGGKQSVLTGVFVSIGFFFSFYALIQLGTILGKTHLLYPWAGAWMPNIVFLFAGILLLAKMR